MKEHFLYVCGAGSKWENQELKYSLRSVEKNVKEFDVTVVGIIPDWVKAGSLQYIPIPEPSGNRLFRVAAKIAAALPYMPDNFIHMADDFVLMEPIDFFETIYTGTLKQKLAMEQSGGYNSVHLKAEQNTLEAFIDTEKELLDYDAHAPFPMCRDFAFSMFAAFPVWKDMQWKCVYGNMFEIGGIQGPNAKIETWAGWKYLSLCEYPNPETQKLMHETFPEPSRFEIT